MKHIILNNWNFMRVLRLALGIFILVQGIGMKDWPVAALGGLFALMPLFNIGCCCAGGCGVPPQRQKKEGTEEVIYEELK